VEEKTNAEYINLVEASKLCSYSEPYLRLRARQGKLKSIKLGKKWMTTELWIKDYVKRTKEWNEKIAAKKAQVKEIKATTKEPEIKGMKEEREIKAEEAPVEKREIVQEAQSGQIDEPEVLTINEKPADQIRDKIKEKTWNEPRLIDRNPVPDFALVIGSALMFTLAIFFAVSSGSNPYAPLNPSKDLLGSGQAAAKKGVDDAVLKELSSDLPMPKCYCQNRESLQEGDADKKEGFLTRVARGVAERDFNVFWPW
jgi:hypothetical protein